MEHQQDMVELMLSTRSEQPSLLFCPLASWGMINLTGDDRVSYLQGQVTCDVVTLDKQESTFGAHCDAKGKVWSVFRLFHHLDGFAMFQPKSAIEAELTELKKYAVFSKAEFSESQEVLIGVIGQQATQWVDDNSTEQGNVRTLKQGTAVKIDDNRWLLALDAKVAQSLLDEQKNHLVDEVFWTLQEIKGGYPILSKDQQCTHIPQALNLHLLDGISFTKGCYTGQETVARAKYRGMNKRALFIVHGETETDLPTDSQVELERAVGENWRSAGTLLAFAQFSDNRAIGLLILAKDFEADSPLRLKSQPNTLWKISPLPYSLEEK